MNMLKEAKAGFRQTQRLFYRGSERELFKKKHDQKSVFEELRKKVPALYAEFCEYNTEPFMAPWWKKYHEDLSRIFLPEVPFDFLRNDLLAETMFVRAGGRWMGEEMRFLEQ